MKNIILISVLCRIFTSTADAQWAWQNPLPQGNILNSVSIIVDEGWAVGAFGTALHTSDAGQTWEMVNLGTTENLRSVHMHSENTIWIVGDNGLTIYIYNDGGNLNITTRDINASENLNSVQSNLGADQCIWICGDNSTIIKSSDYGQTFFHQNFNYTANLKSLTFNECNNAWAVGGTKYIYYTSDLGNNWTIKQSGTNYGLYDINIAQLNNIRVCGEGGVILHSSDMGASWQIEHTNPGYTLYGIINVGTNSSYAVGDAGTILETTDYGANWITRNSNTAVQLNNVDHQYEPDAVWVTGNYGMLLYNSGIGTDFTVKTEGTRLSIYSVDFVDNNTGWAVGGDYGIGGTIDGVILKTTNGGSQWFGQAIYFDEPLSAVDFVNEDKGWAVGYNGRILHTVNGGENWFNQTSPATGDLYALHFIDENNGWAAGRYSWLIHTTNGGGTWTAQNSTTANWLDGIYFVNKDTGWAVGSDSTLLYTTNGGVNWGRQNTNASNNYRFNSVYFSDENHGWITGIYGSILLTTDGGNHWQEIESPTNVILNSVYFLDNKNGWIVGQYGTILRSSDGGFSWYKLYNKIFGNTLYSVHFTDYDCGWVAGEGGAILHTTTGGSLIIADEFWRNYLNLQILDFTLVEDFLQVVVSPEYLQDHRLVGVMLMIDTVFHTSDSDLQFTLSHNTITDTVVYRVGGDGDNFINTRLTDVAELCIEEGTAPFTGKFKPHSPLSSFAGMDPNGEWKLSIYDAASGNTGTLQAWGLKLFYETPVEVKTENSSTPENFTLFQNYPNPFNPSTVIGYQLPVSGNVTLKVYDLLGREVATLVDEYKPAGNYEVEFSAATLSSGIYFYRLRAGEFIQTKKMLLIK